MEQALQELLQAFDDGKTIEAFFTQHNKPPAWEDLITPFQIQSIFNGCGADDKYLRVKDHPTKKD